MLYDEIEKKIKKKTKTKSPSKSRKAELNSQTYNPLNSRFGLNSVAQQHKN